MQREPSRELVLRRFIHAFEDDAHDHGRRGRGGARRSVADPDGRRPGGLGSFFLSEGDLTDGEAAPPLDQ